MPCRAQAAAVKPASEQARKMLSVFRSGGFAPPGPARRTSIQQEGVTPMGASQSRGSAILWTDLALVACLVGVDVIARLVPHAPDFTPVAATALFAGAI